MGKKMTRQEELNGLKAVYDSIASIPDEKIFDYFYKNSPTFKKDVDTNVELKISQESLPEQIDEQTMKLYQNYLALAALRNYAAMLYPTYLKRAEYSSRDMSYPLDVVIQG